MKININFNDDIVDIYRAYYNDPQYYEEFMKFFKEKFVKDLIEIEKEINGNQFENIKE